jgi:uncharacterized lipoprotein YmbA
MKKIVGASLLLAACASPPPVHYWSLAAPVTAVPATCASNIQIGPVIVPDAYDRPDVVVTHGAHEITWSGNDQWEAPLPKVLGGRLATSLRQELGTGQVYTWPSMLAEAPDFTVQVQIQQIRATLGGPVSFDAIWAVKTAKGSTRNNAALFDQGATGADYAGVVDAVGLDTDMLGAAIARDIRAVGGCPPTSTGS